MPLAVSTAVNKTITVNSSGIVMTTNNPSNLAPMFQGGVCEWGDYDLYGEVRYGTGEQISYRDNNVLHNGHSSIRIDGPNSVNLYREVNEGWYSVKPGDHIVFKCWVKTAALTSGTGKGAIIGFDCVGNNIRVMEAHTRNPQSGVWDYPQTGYAVYVPYGSDWTLLTLDTTIPATYYTHDYNGKPISPTQIQIIGLWITGSWHDQDMYPSVWFADAEFYINP